MVQAIEQGDCQSCECDDADWLVTDRDFHSSGIDRLLSCRNCQSRALVQISEDGLSVYGRISHQSASWHDSDESETEA